jgi:SAM-dependent methyltransferase
MTSCPVCSATHTSLFLTRRQTPVHQNLVMPDASSARTVQRGELSMMVCDECGFVFNAAFDPGKLAYGEDYDNTQSCSAYFDEYLNDLVRELVETRGVTNADIVEVGCGKGHFLRKLVEYPSARNRGTGFDPSYAGPSTDLDGRLRFVNRFYDGSSSRVPADFVVCRHVVEHVQNPAGLLTSIRSALRSSPRARVFFETPCVEWILSNRVIWDLFYEHCSLFSESSLTYLFEKSGFAVDRTDHIFGGQYLWLEARTRVENFNRPQRSDRGRIAGLARRYGAEEDEQRQNWLQRLVELRRHGKVALWGAGAKGATFANLVDPEVELLDCVVDINPNKQGRYIPGTGHPIVSPYSLSDREIRSAVLMNSNYRNENQRILERGNLEAQLVDWNES